MTIVGLNKNRPVGWAGFGAVEEMPYFITSAMVVFSSFWEV